MKRILFALILVVFIASQGLAQDGFLIKVSPLTPQETNLIKESGVIAIAKTADYYLAEATSENLEYFKSVGISYQVLDDEAEFSLYYFIWAKPGEDISRYLDQIKEKVTVLEAEGSRAIVKGYPKRIEELTSSGLSIKLIKKKPLPIKSEEEYPFTAKAKISAYSPLINQIIQKVTTGKLYDYVADLSGENEVLIGGIPETLLTRYTYTEGCDQAAQYIKEKLESYGLTAWYDTFTIPKKFPGYIRDIISTTDGDTAWLGCQYTGIRKTTDAGNSWYEISGTESYSLWALSYPAPETLYGAGDDGVIIKSIDGGNSWFQLSSPTAQSLLGIYFENSQRGWVSGYTGIILNTTDGGQNWSAQTSGTTSILFDIIFVDSNNGWAVGSGGVIRHTTDGGASWNAQTSGTTATLRGVEFATTGKGWVCGDNGTLRYTTNAGVNWNAQTIGTTARIYMVSAPDSLEAWAVGYYGTILHTTDAGLNWIPQSSPYRYGYFCDVYFIDKLRGWTVGYNDILYTTDGGQNWNLQMNNLYPQYLKYNVVAELPGQTEPGKECLITAHYDAITGDPNYTPGADDNASGVAAVLSAAEILKDYAFNYTLKFIGFPGEEQGLLGSDAYAEEAYQRGDTIIGVYNFDMISWDGDNIDNIDIHAGEGASSQALADIMIGVVNDYGLSLIPQKITTGATDRSDHASFWNYGYPAVLGIEDFDDFNIYYHTTDDQISTLDLPYFTDFSKAGIASLAILAQPLQTIIYGDANGDGDVTISDVIYIINHLFRGGPPPDPFLSGDADCDGDVDVIDVIYLINALFKGGPPPGC